MGQESMEQNTWIAYYGNTQAGFGGCGRTHGLLTVVTNRLVLGDVVEHRDSLLW